MTAVDDVVSTIAESAGAIRDSFADRGGTTGDTNPSGEERIEADVAADEVLADRLGSLANVGEYASEERPAVVDCGGTPGEGAVAVAVDPLDGSSNLRSNNPVGTIFGVYDAPLPAAGRDLLAAGYVLYGPRVTMVVADESGVTEYALEDGQRRVRRSDVSLPEDPVVYGFGGRVPDWTEGFRAYAREVETELKRRYGGAMVADVNQVVTYGGVFSYPALESRPEGKLRLQFEAAPMGYVVERAGGRSSDGGRSLLAAEPADLHERTPVHVGNGPLIERLESALE